MLKIPFKKHIFNWFLELLQLTTVVFIVEALSWSEKFDVVWKSSAAQLQENVCLVTTVLIGEKLVPNWEFNNPMDKWSYTEAAPTILSQCFSKKVWQVFTQTQMQTLTLVIWSGVLCSDLMKHLYPNLECNLWLLPVAILDILYYKTFRK